MKSEAGRRALRTLFQFIVAGGLTTVVNALTGLDPFVLVMVQGFNTLVVSYAQNWLEDTKGLPAMLKDPSSPEPEPEPFLSAFTPVHEEGVTAVGEFEIAPSLDATGPMAVPDQVALLVRLESAVARIEGFVEEGEGYDGPYFFALPEDHVLVAVAATDVEDVVAAPERPAAGMLEPL